LHRGRFSVVTTVVTLQVSLLKNPARGSIQTDAIGENLLHVYRNGPAEWFQAPGASRGNRWGWVCCRDYDSVGTVFRVHFRGGAGLLGAAPKKSRFTMTIRRSR